jgi:tetratricopeptide (TPR) repeat protein
MQTQDLAQTRSEDRFIEIDPFGCPYCGGPVAGEVPQCNHCGRSVELRVRRKPGGTALGWLVVFFLVLSAAAWLQGLLLTVMVSAGTVPRWMDQVIFRLAIGQAFFNPKGIADDLAQTAAMLTLADNVLAGLGIAAALGLALKSRFVYFAAFLVLILMAAAPVAALLTGLMGWVPVLVLFGVLAFAAKWLADMASAFEWKTRIYHADLDPGLKTHVDYYNRGQHYAGIEMWAKAAAHWRIATQLAPREVPYHAALARAFAQLAYPAAARAAADRALALDPEDGALRALRNSLAGPEEPT